MRKVSIFSLSLIFVVLFSASTFATSYYCEWSWPQKITNADTSEALYTCPAATPYCKPSTTMCCKWTEAQGYYDCVDSGIEEEEEAPPEEVPVSYGCDWTWPQKIKNTNNNEILWICGTGGRNYCKSGTTYCCEHTDAQGHFNCVDMQTGEIVQSTVIEEEEEEQPSEEGAIEYSCDWTWPQKIKNKNTNTILWSCGGGRNYCKPSTSYCCYYNEATKLHYNCKDMKTGQIVQEEEQEEQPVEYSCDWTWPQKIKNKNTGKILWTCGSGRNYCKPSTSYCCQYSEATKQYSDCKDMKTGQIVQEQEPTADLCAGIVCQQVDKECPDGEKVTCTPLCNKDTGKCGTCEPDCKGHEQEAPEEAQ